MVQVLVTTFFSAAAMSALSVIALALAEDFDAVMIALRVSRPLPVRSATSVRVCRTDAAGMAARGFAQPALRVAA